MCTQGHVGANTRGEVGGEVGLLPGSVGRLQVMLELKEVTWEALLVFELLL